MQETWVRFLGWEDSLEKEMATHSSQYSCLENPTDRGAWQATDHGVARVRQDFLYTYIYNEQSKLEITVVGRTIFP